MSAGSPPKPPAGKPAPKPVAAAPTPKAPVAAKPIDALSREEIRGIAQAIARTESASLRDDLVARLGRLEDRIIAIEKRPITQPPAPPALPAPAAPIPGFAPAQGVVPVLAPALAPAPAFVPVTPAIAPAPALVREPLLDVPIIVDDGDLPFVSGARRRKRMGIVLFLLLLATVGTIVVAAIVSQAMNNHS